MIPRESLIEVGTILKPHGINGEVNVTTDYDIDFMALKCVVIQLDGIFVPFFVESERPRGASSVLLKIEGIDDERSAAKLSRHDLFALRTDLDIEDSDSADGFYAEDMIGFTIFDTDAGEIGRVTDINDSTDNVLFIVTRADGSELYIPVAEEMIVDIDASSRKCTMNLPEGLLQLN